MRYVVSPTVIEQQVGGRVKIFKGKVAQFQNYEFSTKDEEIIQHLKEHPDMGISLWVMDEEEKPMDEEEKPKKAAK
jgi:hypothetical protein